MIIAHYKMNENTASDNDELVTNGSFADWSLDDPDSWTVDGESGNDPEVSEAATGDAHADTPSPGGGMCNLYTSGGTDIQISQTISYVVGRKYRLSINIDTITAGVLRVADDVNNQWVIGIYSTTGIKTITFVATVTSSDLQIRRHIAITTDITFDDVSIKLCAVEDSSGNDHDGLAQQDTDAISAANSRGVGTCFDFNGSSDYIEIADHDDFSPVLIPFSISAWVYMHNAIYFVWASKWQVGSNQEWNIFTGTTKKVHFRMYDDSENAYIGRQYNASLASYENQWTHFVFTYDGGILSSGIKIYLNGNRVDDADSESGNFISVENLLQTVWIGRYDTKYSNGLFDNVMFFNHELNADEVKALYNGGHGTEIVGVIDDSRRIPRR